MGHSRAEKTASRERILDAAAILIRASGLDGFSIPEVMKSAGLTHGAFYAHFESRQALVAAAVERALDRGREAAAETMEACAVGEFAAGYLTNVHRDSREVGCTVTALAAEAIRNEPLRQLFGARIVDDVERMSEDLGGGEPNRTKARAIWSLMVGAMTLARLTDPPHSEAVLAAARQAVDTLIERTEPETKANLGAPAPAC